ncbi:MAG: alpha/beta hydrolase, partial [Novosphingobium sp.]
MAGDPLELVAPELAPALEFFPELDFSLGMAALRGGFAKRAVPPLPPGLEAVAAQERFIPSAIGGAGVGVLDHAP